MFRLYNLSLVFYAFSVITHATICIGSDRAFYYTDQLVDHLSNDDITRSLGRSKKWKQRYYIDDKHFKRPGPIFLIMGGEEAIDPDTGILYPFVSDHLAKEMNGLVLQLEHRFYGNSQPLKDTKHVTNKDLSKLMTPEQAMWDAVQFLDYIKYWYGCDATSPSSRHINNYCPVIAIGGSYPGFLAAMMRFVHPSKIDAAYAASAPMKFYAQTVDQFAYYDKVTEVAEKSSPGCVNAVKTALMNVIDVIAKGVVTLEEAASKMGICSIPSYMNDKTTFVNEIMMIVGYTFANHNMANYPPNNSTKLYQACQIFQDGNMSFFDQLYSFFKPYWSNCQSHSLPSYFSRHKAPTCFNLQSQIPNGPNATISAGDWSGVGTGWSGNMWDFQTCSLLVEKIGFSKQSMFPPRTWTLEWLQDHCRRRFQVTPQPDLLVNQWGFDMDHLIENGASRILFTNGLNDGWSVSGIQTNLSSSVIALNFENGAHHSDLSRRGPTEDDTDDIREGFGKIREILESFVALATNDVKIMATNDYIGIDGENAMDS